MIKNSFRKTVILLIIFICMSVQLTYAQNWSDLNSNIDANPDCFFTDNDTLYIGGHFRTIQNKSIIGLATYSNGNFDSIGGITGSVSAICMYQGKLVVAGNIFNDGNLIAIRNGQAWNILGRTDRMIHDLKEYKGALYAAGEFTAIDSIACKFIAKYNGSSWDAVNSNQWKGSVIYTLATYHDSLFAGGNFIDSTLSIFRVGKFDGTTWYPAGAGVRTTSVSPAVQKAIDVHTLCVFNNELYAGGFFYGSENVGTNCIMRWNGTSWASVGQPFNFNNPVNTLTVWNNYLIAAGDFRNPGPGLTYKIARWDQSEWCILGSGMNGQIFKSVTFNDSLFLSGYFTTVDSIAMQRIVKWEGGNSTLYCEPNGIEESSDEIIAAYPNPFNEEFRISINGTSDLDLRMFDLLGNQVNIDLYFSSYAITVKPVSSIPSGIYLLKIIQDKRSEIIKVIKN
jgi:hypothetical protein